MPRVLSSGSPSKAKKIRMHQATSVDLTAIMRRWAGSVPLVSEAKIGAQPGGSMITSKVMKAVVNSSITGPAGPEVLRGDGRDHSVLRSRQAIVIGPTPPGTGVIAPATSMASSKATSPTNLRVAVRRLDRLMPTSMTVAPGFSQPPLTISGRPTAATTMSARRTTSGRSRVRLWAMVTVQLSPAAAAAPSACRRCWSGRSRRRPARTRIAELLLQQHRGSRAACRARARRCPIASRPALIGWKPSTSLTGSMRGDHLPARRFASGSGSWTRMPSTAGVGVQPSTSAISSASLISAGRLVLEALHARFARRLALGADIDGARRILADQHHGEARRAAGGGAEGSTSAATRERRCWAAARPSIRRRGHRLSRDRSASRHRPSSLLIDGDGEQQDERRKIDAAEIRQELADRPV